MTAEYGIGWRAHVAGCTLNACPYRKGTTEARRWCRGWFDCRDDPVRLQEAGTQAYLESRYY